MVAKSFLAAVFFPLVVSGTPGCSCAASSCCSNGVPRTQNIPHPHCEFSAILYQKGVISNDTLCNVSDTSGICDAIASDKAFVERYRSDAISSSPVGKESFVVHNEWLGPASVLQEGSCQDLPDSGCGVLDDHLSPDVWFSMTIAGCQVNSLFSINNGTEELSLAMMQRCASYLSDPSMQDVQDQMEISLEWRHGDFDGMCEKEAMFKIDRTQWREGPQGAQYVCLDLPQQDSIVSKKSALRLVVLNVGNLPCEGIINPPPSLSITAKLSLLVTSTILLLRNLQ